MFDFATSPYPIREDIARAYKTYWQALAAPGTHWTGAQRVAIAQASRNALDCDFCGQRKGSLSPYGFEDQPHQDASDLPAPAVDAVHRIITDQSRITKRYVADNVAAGLSDVAYVELVGIVVTTFSIDEFHRALGIPLEPLPAPEVGEPSHYQPPFLTHDMGFVATLPGDKAIGAEADLWPGDMTANVVRALSAVPNALREWRAVADAQYLTFARMRNFEQAADRSIDRMQMELVAGRVSAVNECFY